MLKIYDRQCHEYLDGEYTLSEAVKLLTEKHNNDFTGERKDGTPYENIEQLFIERGYNTDEEKSMWLCEYGDWEFQVKLNIK